MLLAERLVGEARARRAAQMDRRERLVDGCSAVLFVVAAAAIATFLPTERSADPLLYAALAIGYALVSRVRFEFAEAYISAEDLVFLPMLLLLPAPYVPVLVTVAAVLAVGPECLSGTWNSQRWVTAVADCWFCIGPVLIVGALVPGTPALSDAGVYAVAFGGYIAGDFGWAFARDRLVHPVPLRELARNYAATIRVTATFSSLGFVIGLVAEDQVAALGVIAPVVWLFHTFSRDRRERYTATLELNRAYRGTVMLLADVVEFEDDYTASHSRSVVELVAAIADEMNIDPNSRQELEFAALLHDVGKISIPKEVLNKPSSLNDDEWELMKTHTIEGQFMLDRVGGLLGRVGEIVRSCHERWDGRGYPDGLKGEEIPIQARIVFVCDAFNAMTTDRVYRPAMSQEAAIEELRRHSGTQFDPDVVAATIKVLQEREPELRPVDQVRAVLASVPAAQRVHAAG